MPRFMLENENSRGNCLGCKNFWSGQRDSGLARETDPSG